MLAYLRLLRLPNLIVVGLTQSIIYYHLLLPAFQQAGLTPNLHHWTFAALVSVTIAITAAGYIINDLVDLESDLVNRADKVPLKTLGQDQGYWLYLMFTLIGFALSIMLALYLKEGSLLWIFPAATTLLALYSPYIKPLPFAGNLLVAIYCAGVPAIIGLAERTTLHELYLANPDLGIRTLRILGIYCLFASVVTLLRELVKDIQDTKGDRLIGRQTLPILLGMRSSRYLGLALASSSIITLLTPYLLGWDSFQQPVPAIGISLFVMALVYFSIRILKGRDAADFGRISTQLKVFLLAGLSLLFFL